MMRRSTILIIISIFLLFPARSFAHPSAQFQSCADYQFTIADLVLQGGSDNYTPPQQAQCVRFVPANQSASFSINGTSLTGTQDIPLFAGGGVIAVDATGTDVQIYWGQDASTCITVHVPDDIGTEIAYDGAGYFGRINIASLTFFDRMTGNWDYTATIRTFPNHPPGGFSVSAGTTIDAAALGGRDRIDAYDYVSSFDATFCGLDTLPTPTPGTTTPTYTPSPTGSPTPTPGTPTATMTPTATSAPPAPGYTICQNYGSVASGGRYAVTINGDLYGSYVQIIWTFPPGAFITLNGVTTTGIPFASVIVGNDAAYTARHTAYSTFTGLTAPNEANIFTVRVCGRPALATATPLDAFGSPTPTLTPLPATGTPTDTPTDTPTLTPSPSPSASPLPGATPGTLPTATIYCPVGPTPPFAFLGEVPDLSISLPTLRALPTSSITSTSQISATAVVGLVATLQAGISTPAAAVGTATSGYSYAGGATIAASWSTSMAPAFEWLALLNPANSAWTAEGGPLWSIAPVLLPLAPLISIGVLIVFARFLLWFLDRLQRIVDLAMRLIELIPGE